MVLLAEDGGSFGSEDKPIAYRVSGKCWVNNHAHVLKPKENIDADYLCYSLMFYKTDGLVNGTTRQKLTQSAMRQMLIPKRDLSQQIEIVIKLKKIESVINLRKEQLKKLDELVKSRFIEMFGDSKNTKYHVTIIGTVAKLQGGYAFKSSDYGEMGVPIVQIANVNRDNLDWNEVNRIPFEFLERYSEFALQSGDLVMAMTRPVIKSLNAVKIAIVSENDIPCLLNQRVGRFRIDRTKLNPTYLMACCQMPEFKDYVVAMSGNSLQPNISSKQVENYDIVLPPMELQNQFAAFVEQIGKSKSEIKKSFEKLELLKKSLMQKYFG